MAPLLRRRASSAPASEAPSPHRAALGRAAARLAALGIVAAAACAPGPLVLGVPFEPEDQSALVVVDQGRALEVYAVEAARRDETPVLRRLSEVSDAAPLTVSVVFYREPLGALGLTPGLVEAPAVGAPSRGVPSTFRHAAQARVTGAEGGGWARLQALVDPLTRLELPTISPCRSFGVPARHELGGEAFGVGVVAVDEDTAVIAVSSTDAFGRSSTRLYPTTRSGVGTPRLLPALAATAIARGQDGRLWLSAHDVLTNTATVVVGSVADGFAPLPGARRAAADGFEGLAAPRTDEGDPVLMYGIGGRGRVEAYTPAGWSLLGTIPVIGPRGFGRIGWQGPGDLLVSAPDGLSIARARTGRVDAESVDVELAPGSSGEQVTTVATVPGLGAFAGTLSGYLLARDAGDARWAVHTEPLVLNNTIWTIEPYAGGMLTGENRGAIAQHYAPAVTGTPDGRCDEEVVRVGNEAVVRGMARIRGGVVVLAIDFTRREEPRAFAVVLPE